MKLYIDISSLIVRFMEKYKLKDLYLKKISEDKSPCISCGRIGDYNHDGECELIFKSLTNEYCFTSQSYRKQIDEIFKLHLKV